MNILTFDIEDWYNIGFISSDINWSKYEVRIYENVDRILQKLAASDVKATFFCLGWVASKHPQVIKRIQLQGHQIGCHSNLHELVFRYNKTQFKSDTEEAIKKIEDVTGEKVDLYRAPGFSIDEKSLWALEILAENNIKYDCSINPSTHHYGSYPAFGKAEPTLLNIDGYILKEFPMNTMKFLNQEIVFSGGGYFRLFPYSMIRSWMRKSDYVMTYFHPRDFDSDQPILSHLPLHQKFRSYVGIKSAFTKFEKLIDDFEFMTVKNADKLIDWSKARIIKIL